MRLFGWFAIFEFGFVGIGLIAGPAMGRVKRSYFAARVLVICGGLLAALVVVVTQSALPVGLAIRLWLLATVVALTLGPILWYRSPGKSDADGHGGSGPGRPSPRPADPFGGAPLLDAEQADTRVRDHNRPRLTERRLRRPAREPGQTPVRPGGAAAR